MTGYSQPPTEVCAACEEAPAVDIGLCRECADWCAAFFTKLFPADDDGAGFTGGTR